MHFNTFPSLLVSVLCAVEIASAASVPGLRQKQARSVLSKRETAMQNARYVGCQIPQQRDVIIDAWDDAKTFAWLALDGIDTGLSAGRTANNNAVQHNRQLLMKYFKTVDPTALAPVRSVFDKISSLAATQYPLLRFSCGDVSTTLPTEYPGFDPVAHGCANGQTGAYVLLRPDAQDPNLDRATNDIALCDGFFGATLLGRMDAILLTFLTQGLAAAKQTQFCKEVDFRIGMSTTVTDPGMGINFGSEPRERRRRFRGLLLLHEFTHTDLMGGHITSRRPQDDVPSTGTSDFEYGEELTVPLAAGEGIQNADSYVQYAWEAAMYKLCGEEPETLVSVASLGIRRRSSSSPINTLSARNDPKTKPKVTAPKAGAGKRIIPKSRVSCNKATKKCTLKDRKPEDKCPVANFKTQVFDRTTKTCKNLPAQTFAIKPMKPSAEYTKMSKCLATKGADMFYIPTFLGLNTRIGKKLPKTVVPGTCIKDPSAVAAPQVKNPKAPLPGPKNPGNTTPPPGNKKPPVQPVRRPSLDKGKGKGPVPPRK